MAPHDEEAAGRLRQAVRDLRTLLVEIHPPSLESAGLEATLSDLLSPLAAAGVETSLRVEGVPTPNDPLVYRVTREALRNVSQHAQASRVHVAVDGGRLEVRDDGLGFDAAERAARRGDNHVGLDLMEELVARSGGTLEVQSAPGAGTTVVMELRS